MGIKGIEVVAKSAFDIIDLIGKSISEAKENNRQKEILTEHELIREECKLYTLSNIDEPFQPLALTRAFGNTIEEAELKLMKDAKLQSANLILNIRTTVLSIEGTVLYYLEGTIARLVDIKEKEKENVPSLEDAWLSKIQKLNLKLEYEIISEQEFKLREKELRSIMTSTKKKLEEEEIEQKNNAKVKLEKYSQLLNSSIVERYPSLKKLEPEEMRDIIEAVNKLNKPCDIHTFCSENNYKMSYIMALLNNKSIGGRKESGSWFITNFIES